MLRGRFLDNQPEYDQPIVPRGQKPVDRGSPAKKAPEPAPEDKAKAKGKEVPLYHPEP